MRIDSPLTAVQGICVAGAVLTLTIQPQALGQNTPTGGRTVYEDLQMFSQVLNQIRVNHPDSIDTHVLLMAAIEGMVRAADPHSYVLPYYRLSEWLQEARKEGKLCPIPVDFAYSSGAPIVVRVHPGTEAAELDILPGDELVAIAGEPVTAESEPELSLILSGKKNSRVSLTFERTHREGSLVTLEREVKREEVEDMSAVVASLMLDDSNGYLRLTHFGSKDAVRDLRAGLRDLERQGMQRLVLDLRDNAGGMVEAAGEIAGEFLPRGSIVYTVEGRKSDVTDTLRAPSSSSSRESRAPMVVIVDRGTASAAELVAGALQDHDRALIVGRPTFGKSLVTRGFPMADGSLIVLVVGHLKTPCGRIVQRRYQDIRTHDYFRGAGAVIDTTGRPSCVTSAGRTVYGGGGIYPDVLFETREKTTPRWFTQIQELQLPLRWAGSYLSDTEFAGITPEAFARGSIPSSVVDGFVALAAGAGVIVPGDDKALLEQTLMLQVAWARWGPQGFYTVVALRDPAVATAVTHLERAGRLLADSKR